MSAAVRTSRTQESSLRLVLRLILIVARLVLFLALLARTQLVLLLVRTRNRGRTPFLLHDRASARAAERARPRAPQIIMTGASTSVRATTIDNYSLPANR